MLLWREIREYWSEKKQEKRVNLDFVKGEITRLWFCMYFLKIKLTSDIRIQSQVFCCHRRQHCTTLSTNISIFLCLLQIRYSLPYFRFSRCIGCLCRTATNIWTVRNALKQGIHTAAGAWERAGECCWCFLGCRQWNSSNFDMCCRLLFSVVIPALCTQPYTSDSDLILSHRHWYQSSVLTNKSPLTSADLISLGKYILFCWYCWYCWKIGIHILTAFFITLWIVQSNVLQEIKRVLPI